MEGQAPGTASVKTDFFGETWPPVSLSSYKVQSS